MDTRMNARRNGRWAVWNTLPSCALEISVSGWQDLDSRGAVGPDRPGPAAYQRQKVYNKLIKSIDHQLYILVDGQETTTQLKSATWHLFKYAC